MLRPSEPDEYPQASLCREVEQPARRRGEGAHTVRAEPANRRKVALDLGRAPETARHAADGERPVRHATDEDLLTVVEEELAQPPAAGLDARPRGIRKRQPTAPRPPGSLSSWLRGGSRPLSGSGVKSIKDRAWVQAWKLARCQAIVKEDPSSLDRAMIRIRSLDHFVLRVRDLDRSLAFYRGSSASPSKASRHTAAESVRSSRCGSENRYSTSFPTRRTTPARRAPAALSISA